MGLVTIGVVRIPILQRELRPGLARARPGTRGALPLGVAFAIGWTPCIGPVLAAILTAAAAATVRGAALLFVYSLGLGIPFLLLAWGVAGADRQKCAVLVLIFQLPGLHRSDFVSEYHGLPRSRSPSFSRIWPTWVFAVLSPRNSVPADLAVMWNPAVPGLRLN